ncbi:ABC transporter ATP-binding protein [Crocosphaera watsonii]|uniref:Ferric iron ABC transporter, ATP-binding protein n=1 Tax=Crocosphaera watsonii WH 8502 TaxID=423474 RepID=T2IAI4_CROWT|nr:ABC transporter ATP-binding protein [Crocosphaera watsonii]CCQ50113.1 Ferric iron ABC transporter, ATP-binding protein [Crocosphaera watsonii WH 8502]
MTDSIILQVDRIAKQFAADTLRVVDEVSFQLAPGEILGLLGPSGCGKNTLLRMIAGFEQPTTGTITLGGDMVASASRLLPPEKRNTGMVFQDYALFPHLNIAKNIAFGLNKRRLNKKQIKQRIDEVLTLIGLEGLEKRYPHQLSGGQQQRVALARALAPQPALILLDEPLSNLDVQVRVRLRHEIRQILKATGITAIFVTHDQEEALAICDRIGVMSQGKIEQLGTPEAIYTRPASRFVAEFVTQANFIPAQRQGQLLITEIGAWELTSSQETVSQGDLMVRQEDISLKADDTAKVVISDRQFLGREYRYCLQTPSGGQIHARTTLHTQLEVGTKVQLAIASQSAQIFPAVSS